MAHATVVARESHIAKADHISSTGIFDDRLYVLGSNALQHPVMVDLSQPSPPLQHSVRQAQAMDLQQIQQQLR